MIVGIGRILNNNYGEAGYQFSMFQSVGSFKTADNKTTMLQFITKKLVAKNPEFR
jgi:hypothetical protein